MVASWSQSLFTLMKQFHVEDVILLSCIVLSNRLIFPKVLQGHLLSAPAKIAI